MTQRNLREWEKLKESNVGGSIAKSADAPVAAMSVQRETREGEENAWFNDP